MHLMRHVCAALTNLRVTVPQSLPGPAEYPTYDIPSSLPAPPGDTLGVAPPPIGWASRTGSYAVSGHSGLQHDKLTSTPAGSLLVQPAYSSGSA